MNTIYLVAGGTAGHINAALALGEFFSEKKWRVEYLSGTRYLDKKLFPEKNTLFLETTTIRGKNSLGLVKSLVLNTLSFLKVLKLFLRNKPKLIIGAGGYVCGPTLLAGRILNIPVFIIEQNAVAGLTNKILQKISKKVFTHFQNTKGIDNTNVVVSGNPTRSQIRPPMAHPKDDKIKILVFGGSLGATQINDAISEILKINFEFSLEIVHQVGKDNTFEVVGKNQSIQYTQLEYIDDMNKYYEWANIIVARAGASTISELRIVQKPCILIPYPGATDNHQYFNALELKNENVFPVNIVDQKLKGKELANALIEVINNIQGNKANSSVPSALPMNPCEIIFKEVSHYVRN